MGKRKIARHEQFLLSPSVFKKLVSQGCQKVSLCGNGLISDLKSYFSNWTLLYTCQTPWVCWHSSRKCLGVVGSHSELICRSRVQISDHLECVRKIGYTSLPGLTHVCLGKGLFGKGLVWERVNISSEKLFFKVNTAVYLPDSVGTVT